MDIVKILTEKEKKKLVFKEYKKDEIIFHENALCNYVCLVVEGEIKITSYSYNGKQIIYNTVQSNKFFGNNLIFSNSPYYKGNVIASKNSIVVLITKNELIYLLQNNQKFLIEYLSQQSAFGMSLNRKLKIASFDNAEERLIYLLQENKGLIEFKSVTELSENLFLSREATSRLLSKMIMENKIKRKENIIVLLWSF